MENNDQESEVRNAGYRAFMYGYADTTLPDIDTFIDMFELGANWQKAQGLFTREDMIKVWNHVFDMFRGNASMSFDEFMSSNYPETQGLEPDVKEILEKRIKELKGE
jgi:hypothetical protein